MRTRCDDRIGAGVEGATVGRRRGTRTPRLGAFSDRRRRLVGSR